MQPEQYNPVDISEGVTIEVIDFGKAYSDLFPITGVAQ